MADVGRDRGGRRRLDGRCVTGRAERREGQRAQQHGLGARRAPVDGAPDVEAQADEDAEEQQHTLAHEPDVAEARLERHARHRSRLEGRRRS